MPAFMLSRPVCPSARPPVYFFGVPASAPTLLGRALLLHCPNCGGRGLFSSWLKMKPACPTCGLELNRGESGYNVGSYMLNIIAAELIFAAIFITTIIVTWPNPPWQFLQYGGAILMVLAPIVLYPFTKTVFLAIDLAVRKQS